MTISIDSALGIHPDALRLRERRTELLADNMANADTPGFKARDIDFGTVLAQQGAGVTLASTDPGHIREPAHATAAAAELLYRIPAQSSLDGNTVDPHLEKAAFAENSVRYQTTLMLLGSKIRGLTTAIRGE
ncbi:MAG: flagellar basal body rod protein FlgB [Azonexus sp.]